MVGCGGDVLYEFVCCVFGWVVWIGDGYCGLWYGVDGCVEGVVDGWCWYGCVGVVGKVVFDELMFVG